MSKVRGHKSKQVAVRFTSRQVGKLEKLAVIRDATISDVLRELVDGVAVDITLPYQNSDAGGLVLADPTGITR